MINSLSPSKLRENLYRILDRILDTGEPVAIERKGKRLKIIRDTRGRLDLLKPHPSYLRVDREQIVHMDWSREWRP